MTDQTSNKAPPISPRAEVRADLIRRLFAVAISVGFASALAQKDWVKIGAFPASYLEWQQLFVLSTALLATVASWDGYLVSIKNKPLDGTPRYFLDIALVFIYLYLLIAAQHSQTLLPTLGLIFALYIVWDVLSILEHRETYFVGSSVGSNANVATIYAGGLLGDENFSPRACYERVISLPTWLSIRHTKATICRPANVLA